MSPQALALSCSLLVAPLACRSAPAPEAPSAPDPTYPPAPAPSTEPDPPTHPDPTTDPAPSTEPDPDPPTDPDPAADPMPADAPAPQTLSLFIRERRAECQGEAPMKCLQVRTSPSEPWRNLYTTIEGFRYEEGNAYELRVEVASIPYPALDASSLRYRLLEIVSKEPGGANAP